MRVAVVFLSVLMMLGCGGASEPQVRLADGTATQFSHWEGRWVLINYWAEWCAPCREEIPELNRLHGERNRSGIIVLGVNYDGLRGEGLVDLIGAMGIRFPVLLDDPRERWDQMLPSVLPSTLLIAPDGTLHDVLVGPHDYESFTRATQATTAT